MCSVTSTAQTHRSSFRTMAVWCALKGNDFAYSTISESVLSLRGGSKPAARNPEQDD